MIRLRLVLVLVALVGCWGLAGCQEGACPARTARLQEELKAVQQAREGLRRDLDACRHDLAERQEEIARLQLQVVQLQQERDELKQTLVSRTQERDLHAAALADLRTGIKSLLEKVEAQLSPDRSLPAAMPATVKTASWSF
jgi:chromosome segregation ATPase